MDFYDEVYSARSCILSPSRQSMLFGLRLFVTSRQTARSSKYVVPSCEDGDIIISQSEEVIDGCHPVSSVSFKLRSVDIDTIIIFDS